MMAAAARLIPVRILTSLDKIPPSLRRNIQRLTYSVKKVHCQHHVRRQFHRSAVLVSSQGPSAPSGPGGGDGKDKDGDKGKHVDGSDIAGIGLQGAGGDNAVDSGTNNDDKMADMNSTESTDISEPTPPKTGMDLPGEMLRVVNCSKCGAAIKNIVPVDEKYQARFVKCPNCQQHTIIPENILKPSHLHAPPKPKEKELPTPKQIKHFLDQHVVGQEHAKERLAVAVYNHYKTVRHNLRNKEDQTQSLKKYTPKSEISSLLGLPSNFVGDARASGRSWDREQVDDDGEEEEVVLGKSNILMLGPTGSGKTLLVQTIASILEVPFASCDCTSMTSAGYVGDDVESVIAKLLQNAGGNVDKCEKGIIFLDEIDKISRKSSAGSIFASNKDIGGEGVQQAMLKMLEGTVVKIAEKKNKPSYSSESQTDVDTSNILFIAAGAFNGLEKVVKKRKNVKVLGFGSPVESEERVKNAAFDVYADKPSTREQNAERDRLLQEVEDTDLIDFGLIPEFVGRIPVVVPLHSLNEEMLVRILTEPQNALIKQYQQLFKMDEVQIEFTEEALRAIAHVAMEKQTGARGLRAVVDKCQLMAGFEVPGSDVKTVIITEDVVRKNKPAVYVKEGKQKFQHG
ncbi:ATP-dependent Clp protease ATP-binding subunit ClpX-like [Mya arenaria]|uniref:ATP-dependent Clp protease ATP-binding subunit ClpX-like n=1 Tax=Mya arenaria TaxID=6604 RepID=UPI0022E7BEDC|nr:ATP-dependent Clp protease ATP-binding subunit ClpX-like [Mya arenaria]XP_052796716.1 ATP-dependent Clp protease ATP-binding subunit ClpX-like [Mya arenaria]